MIGITFAAALTCKVSAVIFLPVIGLALILPSEKHENIFQKIIRKVTSFQHLTSNLQHLKRMFVHLFLFGIIALIFGFLFMPYAFIDYVQFLSDVTAQVRMNSDPYVFPYTLQYVGTMPYIYYLKNIFIWGLGPVISILAIVGLISTFRSKFKIQSSKFLILFSISSTLSSLVSRPSNSCVTCFLCTRSLLSWQGSECVSS